LVVCITLSKLTGQSNYVFIVDSVSIKYTTIELLNKIYNLCFQWAECGCCWSRPEFSCGKKCGKDHSSLRCKVWAACK